MPVGLNRSPIYSFIEVKNI